MGIYRNMARINNAYNITAAWRDWNTLRRQAEDGPQAVLDEATRLTPPESAGWKRIDKASLELRLILRAAGLLFNDPMDYVDADKER